MTINQAVIVCPKRGANYLLNCSQRKKQEVKNLSSGKDAKGKSCDTWPE